MDTHSQFAGKDRWSGDPSFSSREEMALDGPAPLSLLSFVDVAEAAALLEYESSMCLYYVSVLCLCTL